MSNDKGRVAELHTSKGEIEIRFFAQVAPNHVRNFLELAEKGFYNGTKFHRVIPGFMIQGGDPNTISGSPLTGGMGGSPNKIRAEFNSISHKRGIVSMARSQDPDSASSQFFIVVKDSNFLEQQVQRLRTGDEGNGSGRRHRQRAERSRQQPPEGAGHDQLDQDPLHHGRGKRPGADVGAIVAGGSRRPRGWSDAVARHRVGYLWGHAGVIRELAPP